MKNRTHQFGFAAIALAATALTSHAAPKVHLNGQPLTTSVSPVVMNGRTLVPMRDIFEALGAKVNYNALTRGISATRDTSTVNLQIGNKAATVNGQTVMLEQAPLAMSGSTLVPLRFVSEAMGAQVSYNSAMQLVSIAQSGSAVAGTRTVTIPSGAVVPVALDTPIDSSTARTGDIFTATVRSKTPGDSEFPSGTRIEGVVTEAMPKSTNPGALAVDFRAAILPDGTRVPLRGALTSLDNNSVIQSQGRIMAKPGETKNNTTRNVLIGGGAGFILGRVLDKNSTVVGALGGIAGYVLAQKDKDKVKVMDVTLPAGTELGVRLDSGVTYTDDAYAATRTSFFKQ